MQKKRTRGRLRGSYFRVLAMSLASMYLCLSLNSVVVEAASAEELSAQMIDYYEDKEYTDDDYANIQEGLQDEDTVRLLGILTSNFMKVGMKVDIEDTAKLAETLVEPINTNIIKDESLANAYASVIAMNVVTSAQKVDVKHIKGETKDRLDPNSSRDPEIIFRAYFSSKIAKYFTEGCKLVRFKRVSNSEAANKKFTTSTTEEATINGDNIYYKYDGELTLAGAVSDDKGIYGVKLESGNVMTAFQLLSRYNEGKYQYYLTDVGSKLESRIYQYREGRSDVPTGGRKKGVKGAKEPTENVDVACLVCEDNTSGASGVVLKATSTYEADKLMSSEDAKGKGVGVILSFMNVDRNNVLAAGDYMDEMTSGSKYGGPSVTSSANGKLNVSFNNMMCGYFQDGVAVGSSPTKVGSAKHIGTTSEYEGDGELSAVFDHSGSKSTSKLNTNLSYIGAHQYDEFYVTGTENLIWSSGNQACRAIGAILRNKLITTGDDKALKACTGSSKANDVDTGYGEINPENIVVDCFGDIWVTDGKGKGYLIVPGCANPYTFSKDGTVAPLNNLHMMGYLYSNAFSSSSAFINTNNYTNACIRRFDTSRYIVDVAMTYKKINSSSTEGFFTKDTSYIRSDVNGKDFRGHWVASKSDAFIKLFKKEVSIRTMGYSLAPSVIEVYSNNAMAYQKGSYSNAYTKEMKTYDLIAFGGVWDENGQVVQLISDGKKELGKSQTFLDDATVTADSKGNVEIKDTKKASFIYGLYLMYAFAVTGEDIEIDKNNFERDINVVIPTSEWGACENLPNVITDISQYQDLLDNMLEGIKSKELDEKKGNIIDALSKILDPEAAWGYVTSLVNQRMSEISLGWHYSLLGLTSNTDNSALSGTNNYSTSNGYVSAPRVEDISVTSFLIDNYDTVVVVSLMVILVILLVYILLSVRTVQRAVLSMIVFGVCLYIVPVALSTTIDISNKVCIKMIDDRFQYWTITQHQSFIEELRKVEEEDNSAKYLSTVSEELSAFATNSTAVATVQWMTPKKDNYINQILGIMGDNGDESSNSLVDNKSIWSIGRQMGTRMLSGQRYVDGKATYLYRSYSDISSSASRIHQAVDYKCANDNNVQSLKYFDTNSFSSNGSTNEAKSDLKQREDLNSSYKLADRLNSNSYKNSYPDDTLNRFRILTTSETVNDSLTKYISRVKIDSSNVTDYTTGKFAYGFSVNYEDKDLKPSTLAKIYKSNDSENYSLDKLGEYKFLTYTESPFYYFYDTLGDRGTLKGGNSAYKSYILKDDVITSSSTKNDKGESCVRDYMDMEGFFKYVLPYMRQATDVVTDYDKLYTMNVYSTILDAEADLNALKNNADYASELSKVWHNAQVGRLWNLYSSWVDTMEECEYAKEETFVTMLNGAQMKVKLKDPLNPASYKKMRKVGNNWYGREMVFSEEQMIKDGLTYSQLSTVEKKLVSIGKEASEDMFNLLNYYTYDDQVLTTAAAMFYTFEFNSEFSQSNKIGGSKILYPQGFAVENMSYDTYLRMTLINTAGLSISGKGSSGVYETIVANTNAFVAILMMLNDILAVYIITNLKIVLVVVMLFLGVVAVLSKITVDEFELLKTFKNSILMPLLKFFILTISHCLIASILIGNTQTSIIKNKGISTSITSPVTVLLVLLVVHIVLTFLYGKLCLGVIKDLVTNSLSVLSNVGGAFAGLGSNLVAATGTTSAGRAVSNLTNSGVKRFKRTGASNIGSVVSRDRGISKAMKSQARDYSRGVRRRRNKTVAGKVNSLVRGTGSVISYSTSKIKSATSIAGRGLYSKTSLGKLRQQERLIRKQRAEGINTAELEKSLASYRKKHRLASGTSKSMNFVGKKYRGVKSAMDKAAYTATAPIRGVKNINRELNRETGRRRRRRVVRSANRKARVSRYFR